MIAPASLAAVIPAIQWGGDGTRVLVSDLWCMRPSACFVLPGT